MQRAFAAMADLERGGIANPDEKRMVGHYWLRNPALAPSGELCRQIEQTVAAVKEFAKQVHDGAVLRARMDGLETCWSLASGDRLWGRSLWPMPLADRAAINWSRFSSIIPTRMECRRSWRASGTAWGRRFVW